MSMPSRGLPWAGAPVDLVEGAEAGGAVVRGVAVAAGVAEAGEGGTGAGRRAGGAAPLRLAGAGCEGEGARVGKVPAPAAVSCSSTLARTSSNGQISSVSSVVPVAVMRSDPEPAPTWRASSSSSSRRLCWAVSRTMAGGGTSTPSKREKPQEQPAVGSAMVLPQLGQSMVRNPLPLYLRSGRPPRGI